MIRQKSIDICQRYHEYVHFIFGLLAVMITKYNFPDYPLIILLFSGLLGTLLPDLDHLLYFFVYGRHQQYALQVKKILHQQGLSAVINYCRLHHKDNHYVLSHNLLSVLILLPILYISLTTSHPIYSVLSISILFHLLFDISEDLLVKKKLNPNWYLKFKKSF